MDFEGALSLIREIPDFPKPGILFLDITPVLSRADAFSSVISEMEKSLGNADILAGIEARGFILASALANRCQKGFVPFRKSGKLPFETFGESYGLEYGHDQIEVHVDAFKFGERVTIIDDVLATGGTILAAVELAKRCGAIIDKIVVLLEIDFLGGRSKILAKHPEVEIVSLKHV